MTFWAYMIQCADRHFYVGHTDDLETRIGQHQHGTFRGYTSTRRPIHLVWSAEFPTRDEARAVELRLKGWRREKKLALIRGDWAAISALARNKNEEGRASTSSAQPGRGPSSLSCFLHPHPSQLPSGSFNFEVGVRRAANRLRLRYRLTGDLDTLRIASPAPSNRRDNLWQQTCFEAFVSTDSGYLEFNLSPSTQWAAYRFTGYREGMDELKITAPDISVSRTEHSLELNADIQLPCDVIPIRLGLSAIIEEKDGRKSYWALRHPPKDTPDFHHPDCFAIDLPVPVLSTSSPRT
jgi:predicted GIY-YIG superfamily endonuclease